MMTRDVADRLQRQAQAIQAMSKSIVLLNQRVQETERRLALAEALIETQAMRLCGKEQEKER